MAATEFGGRGHRRTAPTAAPDSTLLPNFLIVGAQKAGTTALYYALSKHPEVFMSAVKEPAYFVAEEALEEMAGPGDGDHRPVATPGAYRELFAEAGAAAARGEASTSYLYSPGAAARIEAELPGVKLIAILRNPAERAYSNFLHLVRDGREPIHDFRAALDAEAQRREAGWSLSWRYRDKGFYAGQVQRFLDTFGPDRFRCYLYEDYNDDPDSTVRDIYRFLGVESDVAQDLSLRLNVGGVPRSKGLQWLARRAVPPPQDPNNTRARRLRWLIEAMPARLRGGILKAQTSNLSSPPPLPADLREELLDGYRDDVARVGELTGLDVSRWLTRDEPPASIASDEPARA
jgi:hypothetical protein